MFLCKFHFKQSCFSVRKEYLNKIYSYDKDKQKAGKTRYNLLLGRKYAIGVN